MTSENGNGRISYSYLNDCECPFFQALPPSDQESNRMFRRKAREAISRMGVADGDDEGVITGLDGSMCGECVRSRSIEESIQKMIENLVG